MKDQDEHRPSLPPGVPDRINEKGSTYRYRWAWQYNDDFVVVRYDTQSGDDKTIRPYHRTERGAWRAGLPAGPRVLFGLRTLPTAPGATGYIVEGEKCAAALHALWLPCVTSGGGAQSVSKTDWTPFQQISNACILPDNDKSGNTFADDVAAALTTLPGARSVSIARLPDLPEKGDVVDWLQARVPAWDGFGPLPPERAEALRAELLATIEAHAEPYPPEAATKEEWPAPVALPVAASVEAFDPLMLPDTVRPWIVDIAERLQCPLDYAAAAFVVSFGSVVGRQIAIRPKRYADWIEVPNLWGAIVGPPGVLKSPAVAEIMKPLHALEARALERNEADTFKSRAALVVAKAAQKQADSKIMQAVRSGDQASALRLAEECERAENEAAPSACRRYVCNSTTIEKLGELLRHTPSGIMVFRDELPSFLRSLEKPGYEEARGFFLEAWAGTRAFTSDTLKRGTVRIEAATVSIFGTIQPGPLAAYLRDNCQHGGNDGFVPRFQIMVYPDPPLEWRNVDRWPDTEAKRAAHALFELVDTLDVHAVGATCEEGEIPYLRFADDAQGEFNAWQGELETRLRDDSLPPVLQEHLSKYRGLVPALALLLQLAERTPGPVSLLALRKALAWAEYLESHARRVYGLFLRSDDDAGRLLLARIESGALPNPFTERDVKRKDWRGLDESTIPPALVLLEELGHIRLERVPAGQHGGRPTKRYHLHPSYPAQSLKLAANG